MEAKTLHERLRKKNRKQEVNKYQAFDKQMESGKISDALRYLSDDEKGGKLSTSDIIVIRGKTGTDSIFCKKVPR